MKTQPTNQELLQAGRQALDNMAKSFPVKEKKIYKVKAVLEVEYIIEDEESEADAIEIAKGYLLEKIDYRDVAYDELKGRIIRKVK